LVALSRPTKYKATLLQPVDLKTLVATTYLQDIIPGRFLTIGVIAIGEISVV
jgi:hypothetical protein